MDTAQLSNQIQVTPLEAPLGASVTGVDLSRPLTDDIRAAVTKAWHDNVILLFPDQDISGPQQLSFAGLFGPIKERGRPKERRPEIEVDDYESQVMYISNVKENGKPIGSLPDGEMWFHHDGCYKERPQRASFLYALELPSSGGNTKFANMYKAFDAVPKALKKLLADKTALHVYDYELRAQFDIKTGLDSVAHWSQPLFIRHPDTGRTALYTNRLMTARINELSEDESKDVLAELFAIGEDPSVVYEHVWTVGDFVMWDNLCSMHARTDFPAEERRLLRRCVVEGEPVIRA